MRREIRHQGRTWKTKESVENLDGRGDVMGMEERMTFKTEREAEVTDCNENFLFQSPILSSTWPSFFIRYFGVLFQHIAYTTVF